MEKLTAEEVREKKHHFFSYIQLRGAAVLGQFTMPKPSQKFVDLRTEIRRVHGAQIQFLERSFLDRMLKMLLKAAC